MHFIELMENVISVILCLVYSLSYWPIIYFNISDY